VILADLFACRRLAFLVILVDLFACRRLAFLVMLVDLLASCVFSGVNARKSPALGTPLTDISWSYCL
jgi:hypothetical protein